MTSTRQTASWMAVAFLLLSHLVLADEAACSALQLNGTCTAADVSLPSSRAPSDHNDARHIALAVYHTLTYASYYAYHGLRVPLSFLAMSATPWTAGVLWRIVGGLWSAIHWAMTPVLFPLRLLILQPTGYVLSCLLSVRTTLHPIRCNH